ncbi:leucine-rich repeat domain-containing protein [Terrisporobacter sp.]
MIFIIIITTIIFIALLFFAYIFYNNNQKAKHKQNTPKKSPQNHPKKRPTTTLLKKELISNIHLIKSLSINKDIEQIESNLFINCPNLSSIKVEENNKVFCSKLGVLFSNDMTKIIFYPPLKQTSTYFIPQGVEEIDTHTFFNNNYLKYIIMPTTLNYIDESAFVNCKFLSQVVIPENVTQIHPHAFSLCPRITVRCYMGSVAEEFCKKYYIPYEYLTS